MRDATTSAPQPKTSAASISSRPTPASERWSRSTSIGGQSVEPERARALRPSRSEEHRGRDHVAAQRLAAGDPLELAELLERIDADVRVRADAEADPAARDPLDRERSRRRGSPPSSGRRRSARPACASRSSSASDACVAVDDRRARTEAARLGEQLDRPQAVLGEALLDLARLLVGVHVEDEPLARGVGADLLEPVAAGRRGRSGGRRRRGRPPRAAPRPGSR